jgi:hypothetical protein
VLICTALRSLPNPLITKSVNTFAKILYLHQQAKVFSPRLSQANLLLTRPIGFYILRRAHHLFLLLRNEQNFAH